jgi:hypothetical protein
MQDVRPPAPAQTPVQPSPSQAQVAQPAPAAQPPQPSPAPSVASAPNVSPPASQPAPMATQIVDSIPLRQPGQPVQPVAAAQPPHMPGDTPASEPDELDSILQAVNNRVKVPSAAAPQKPKVRVAIGSPLAKLGRLKPKTPSTKPVGIMLATLAVFVVLAGTAVVAYRQGAKKIVASQPSRVGTSYTASAAIQAAGGLLVKPSDLDDYKQDLQTKMGALNDSQDYDGKPLSDQMLGL